jgi:poly-gamma-glutamate synthesis protein (capsule biosynthesis protein)
MRVLRALLIIFAVIAAGIALAQWNPTVRLTIRGPSGPVRAWALPPASSAHLMFVGDIQLSRAVGDHLIRIDDWSWPFARIASATQEADVMFGNLESVVSDRGGTAGCTYCFRADPRVIEGLTGAGFDVLSVANNHAFDYGRDAFADSLARLEAAGIVPVGGGITAARAREPAVFTVGDTSIAYLAYTDLLPAAACAVEGNPGVNCADAGRMADEITKADAMADLVVVSFHTGTEYGPVHDLRQERIYRAAVDAGADVVIGHHPHVIQDTERYRDGVIFYSLGNFIFDQGWSAPTMLGMLVDITVRDGAIEDIATRSVDISSRYQASLR